MKCLSVFLSLMVCVLSVNASNIKAPEPWLKALTQLTDASGPSGFETKVRELVKNQWQSLAKIKVDGMGNVLGTLNPKAKGPRLLLMAHMDEVGFMVESITDNGFLRVVPLGGISDNVVLGQRWVVDAPQGPVKAYSGIEAVHIMDREKRNQAVSKHAMFLDIGAESKQEAIETYQIRPGLAVSPDSQLVKLGKTRYLAKALDDRLGLAAITEVTRELDSNSLPNRLMTAATVQEEIGLRGAGTVYASTKPDVVVNIEIGIADDFPLIMTEKGSDIKLGKGPTLFVYDRSMIPNQGLLNWIIDLAKKNGIPFQFELEQGYGEDGAQLQSSGQGVPTINIGIPVRYAHEHAGVFDSQDFQSAVKLLRLIAQNLDAKAVKSFVN